MKNRELEQSSASDTNWSFAWVSYSLPAITDSHQVLYGPTLESLSRDVVEQVRQISELFYESYSESFNLAEYPDFMDMFQEEERSSLTEIFDIEDDWEFDFVSTALNNRIKASTNAIAAGDYSPDSLNSLVELFNYVMDNGLFLCRDEPWAYVDLTTLKEFAPRFVDHLLATASSPEKTPWLEPFRPFRRLLENYSKAVHREDYFDREIGLGRLFGLIDMFNLLGEPN